MVESVLRLMMDSVHPYISIHIRLRASVFLKLKHECLLC